MFPIRDLAPTRVTPFVTVALIAVNILVFFGWQPFGSTGPDVAEFLYERSAISCEVLQGRPLTYLEIATSTCMDEPTGDTPFPDKQPWLAVFVSLFLHGGLAHLFGNMWFLWLFGNNVEEAFGHLKYLAMYLLAGVAATLVYIFLNPEATQPLIGASGAIAGVLGAYFVLFPKHLVLGLAFFTVVPLPAMVYLGMWFFLQFLVGEPGVAWQAHVGGFVIGALLAAVFRGPLLRHVDRIHNRDTRRPALW